MMRNFFLLVATFIVALDFGQNTNLYYKYQVRDPVFGKVSEFPATLQIKPDHTALYTVNFARAKSEDAGNEAGVFILRTNPDFTYYLQSQRGNNNILISESIDGKKYVFQDEMPAVAFQNEPGTKILKGKTLQKIVAEFRGRKYIIWYDPKSEIKAGPWKFFQVPGLAYEISDEQNLFSWTLLEIQKSKTSSESPFTNNSENLTIRSYQDYPNIRYPRSFIKNEPTQPGHYVNSERTGLETKFEWEK